MRIHQKVERLQRYFRDPVVGDGLLHPPARGLACRNIRQALRLLGYKLGPGDRYDVELKAAVLKFQEDNSHSSLDGYVGPGTRELLVQQLYRKRGERPFRRMKEPRRKLTAPLVFLSYAWEDSKIVDKVDQLLRDNNIRVLRDERDFVPGKKINQSIREAIARADKVVAVYSRKSEGRDWPSFELSVAVQKEESGKENLLIYLVLDDAPLPAYHRGRLAVMAKGLTLGEIRDRLLKSILGRMIKPKRVKYKLNEVLCK